MTIYAGLGVSDKTTHICVVDGEGVVVVTCICARHAKKVLSAIKFRGQ